MVRVLGLTPIAAVTGEGSVNKTGSRFGVYGTDLGIVWESGPGEVLVAFGDSYGREWGGNGAGPAHADWRSNFVVRSTSTNLDQGLLLEPLARRADGTVAQAIARDADTDRENTVIPTRGSPSTTATTCTTCRCTAGASLGTGRPTTAVSRSPRTAG